MYSVHVSDFMSLVASFFQMCLIKLQKDATLPCTFYVSTRWVLRLLRVYAVVSSYACKLWYASTV